MDFEKYNTVYLKYKELVTNISSKDKIDEDFLSKVSDDVADILDDCDYDFESIEKLFKEKINGFETLFSVILKKGSKDLLDKILSKIDLELRMRNICLSMTTGKIFNLNNYDFDKNNKVVNMRDEFGYTLLDLAITQYNISMGVNKDIIQYLLNRPDLDINSKNKSGNTAFHIAVENNCLDVVEMILRIYNLDTNIRNNKGDTVLDIAIKNNNLEMVKKLLSSNIYFNINEEQNSFNHLTPLQFAIVNGYTDIVSCLIDNVNPKLRKIDGYGDYVYDTFYLAVENGNKNILEMLLNKYKNCYNPEEFNIYFTPLLKLAVVNGNSEIIDFFLKKNIVNDDIYVVLFTAIEAGNFSIVKMILNMRNIDLNKKDNCGCSIIELAVKYENSEIFELLLSDRSKKYERCDALRIAAKNKNVSLCKFLLKHINIDPFYYKFTDDFEDEFKQIFDILFQNFLEHPKGKDVMNIIYLVDFAISNKKYNFVKDTLESYGDKINEKSKNGENLLQYILNNYRTAGIGITYSEDGNKKLSVRSGISNKTLKVLLSLDNIKIDGTVSNTDKTLFDIAIEKNNVEIANLILDKNTNSTKNDQELNLNTGDNCNNPDKKIETKEKITYFYTLNHNNNYDSANFVFKEEDDITGLRDENGKCLLDYAIDSNNKRMLKFLTKKSNKRVMEVNSLVKNLKERVKNLKKLEAYIKKQEEILKKTTIKYTRTRWEWLKNKYEKTISLAITNIEEKKSELGLNSTEIGKCYESYKNLNYRNFIDNKEKKLFQSLDEMYNTEFSKKDFSEVLNLQSVVAR